MPFLDFRTAGAHEPIFGLLRNPRSARAAKVAIRAGGDDDRFFVLASIGIDDRWSVKPAAGHIVRVGDVSCVRREGARDALFIVCFNDGLVK